MGIFTPSLMRGKTSKRKSKSQGHRRKSDATRKPVLQLQVDPCGNRRLVAATIPIPSERNYKGIVPPFAYVPDVRGRSTLVGKLVSAPNLTEANQQRKDAKKTVSSRELQVKIDRIHNRPIPVPYMSVQDRIREIKAEYTAEQARRRELHEQNRQKERQKEELRKTLPPLTVWPKSERPYRPGKKERESSKTANILRDVLAGK